MPRRPSTRMRSASSSRTFTLSDLRSFISTSSGGRPAPGRWKRKYWLSSSLMSTMTTLALVSCFSSQAPSTNTGAARAPATSPRPRINTKNACFMRTFPKRLTYNVADSTVKRKFTRPHHDCLGKNTHRAARHGRHAARPALRQPLLARARAAALRRAARHAAGGGPGRADGPLQAGRGHARLVLRRLLEPGTQARYPAAQGGGQPPDRRAPARARFSQGGARRRPAAGAGHQRPRQGDRHQVPAHPTRPPFRRRGLLARPRHSQGKPRFLAEDAAGAAVRQGVGTAGRRLAVGAARGARLRRRPAGGRAPAGLAHAGERCRGIFRDPQLQRGNATAFTLTRRGFMQDRKSVV